MTLLKNGVDEFIDFNKAVKVVKMRKQKSMVI